VIVIVIVIVIVGGPVIVAVHVHGNATVGVIERDQGSMSFVSMATTLSKSPIPGHIARRRQDHRPACQVEISDPRSGPTS
jgi:hypothetical protein